METEDGGGRKEVAVLKDGRTRVGNKLHGCARSVGIALFRDSIQDLIPFGGKRGGLGHNSLEERKMRIVVPNRRLFRHDGDACAVLQSGGLIAGFVMFVVKGKKELLLVWVARLKIWGEGKGKGRE